MYLPPAHYVIFKFGGPQRTADALKMSRYAVHHWKTRYRGRIPSSKQSLILEIAKSEGLDIIASDLIQGRRVDKKLLSAKFCKGAQLDS